MLFGKKCQYCGKEYAAFKYARFPYFDDIDFANIDSVTIVNTEMTYRTEIEEEFDPVMTELLTRQDGWQHYETKTVEYEVENGYEYTFLIYYTNGKSITGTYHESHPTAQCLLEILSTADFAIAYNIIFEKSFVESYIKRTNPMYLFNNRVNWAMDKDPMRMYANYIGGSRWANLEKAAGSFGYNFNAHDSLEDVKATLFLYKQLK